MNLETKEVKKEGQEVVKVKSLGEELPLPVQEIKKK